MANWSTLDSADGSFHDEPGRGGAEAALGPETGEAAISTGAKIISVEGCRTVPKPWGREVWWAVCPVYAAKRLEISAGHALSLQYHELKHETLYVLSGCLRLRLADAEQVVGPGDIAVVPPGTVHRLEAVTDAVVIEVSTPELDDVVRMEDRYGRAACTRGESRHQP